MKRIRDIKIEGNFYLGGVFTITVILDYTPAGNDTVTVSIEDPTDATKLSNGTMTALTSTIYQYSYQTAITDQDGEWVITVKAVSGSYTIYDTRPIEIAENPLED